MSGESIAIGLNTGFILAGLIAIAVGVIAILSRP